MEIFDSGLFGEGILTTLQHAWKELLVHSKLPDVGIILAFLFCKIDQLYQFVKKTVALSLKQLLTVCFIKCFPVS